MTCVAIIPARGGSQRIPRKNARKFYGKPIIAYSIETATQSRLFSAVYVSTDDPEISGISATFGASVLIRPDALCGPDVGTQQVMEHHAAEFSSAAYLCCIYPCAPLMTVGDLKLGLNELKDRAASFAFSVGTDPLCDAGQWYWGTQAAFAFGEEIFGPDSLMIPLPKDRVCDINVERDWVRAELLYQMMQKRVA